MAEASCYQLRHKTNKNFAQIWASIDVVSLAQSDLVYHDIHP